MIWLILILAIPGIAFVTWLTIIETARDHLVTWPATIFTFAILLILIIGLCILIWCLCTTVALSSDVEVEPQNLVETIESKSKILVVNNSSGVVDISYDQEDKLFATKIDAHLSTVEVRKSLNNKNYIEVYTATWASPIRRFLYGKFVPEKYYIVYITGD
jgi:hypothetical protein